MRDASRSQDARAKKSYSEQLCIARLFLTSSAEDPSSPLVYQGSTTATPPTGVSSCVGGRTTHAYFSAMGLSESGDGNPGGPGFLTTDVIDPLSVRFHILDNNSSQGTGYGQPITINWNPLTSADNTNQNPVQP
jgi:hypothetical protein